MDHPKLLLEQHSPPPPPLPGDGAQPPVASPLPPAAALGDRLLPADEIERALGQTVQEALDLHGWEENGSLEALLTRAHHYVTTAVREEGRLRTGVRRRILNCLGTFPDAP